ncbi:MAG: CsbD family protein [Labilithrix sp.]|nr:CsbD family protein [Labilithrix sp.]
MNWERVEGQWHQLKGELKSKWAKLTDDDLKHVGGKKEQLIGKLQERYGVMKEEAERQVNEWVSKLEARPNRSH